MNRCVQKFWMVFTGGTGATGEQQNSQKSCQATLNAS